MTPLVGHVCRKPEANTTQYRLINYTGWRNPLWKTVWRLSAKKFGGYA